MKTRKMVKGILTAFMLMGLCFIVIRGGNAEAKVPKATNKGIKINKVNFPKKKVRKQIKKRFDRNGDGYLSKKETPNKKSISFPNASTPYYCDDPMDMADIISENGYRKDVSYKYEMYFNVKKITFYLVDIKSFDPAAFPYLEELELVYCKNIGKLDFSKNKRLKSIKIYGGEINSLNLNANKNLVHVEINGSPLEKIKLDKCIKMSYLRLTKNKLKQVDVSKNYNLITFIGSKNDFSKVVLGNNKKMKSLDLSNNKLKEIDLMGLSGLNWLNISANELLTIDLMNNKRLEGLEIYQTPISSIQFGDEDKLKYLDISETKITGMDFLKTLVNLKELNIRRTNITKVDVSNLKLNRLDVDEGVEVIR